MVCLPFAYQLFNSGFTKGEQKILIIFLFCEVNKLLSNISRFDIPLEESPVPCHVGVTLQSSCVTVNLSR